MGAGGEALLCRPWVGICWGPWPLGHLSHTLRETPCLQTPLGHAPSRGQRWPLASVTGQADEQVTALGTGRKGSSRRCILSVLLSTALPSPRPYARALPGAFIIGHGAAVHPLNSHPTTLCFPRHTTAPMVLLKQCWAVGPHHGQNGPYLPSSVLAAGPRGCGRLKCTLCSQRITLFTSVNLSEQLSRRTLWPQGPPLPGTARRQVALPASHPMVTHPLLPLHFLKTPHGVSSGVIRTPNLLTLLVFF